MRDGERFQAIVRDLEQFERAEGVRLPMRPSTIAALELQGNMVDLVTGAIMPVPHEGEL